MARGVPYPVTPDGRYFVVRGRLWRCSNPALAPEERERLVAELMRARRQLRGRNVDHAAHAAARQTARIQVERAKVGLGERGPVWWADGAPDHNRKLARNSPYAAWYAAISASDGGG